MAGSVTVGVMLLQPGAAAMVSVALAAAVVVLVSGSVPVGGAATTDNTDEALGCDAPANCPISGETVDGSPRKGTDPPNGCPNASAGVPAPDAPGRSGTNVAVMRVMPAARPR